MVDQIVEDAIMEHLDEDDDDSGGNPGRGTRAKKRDGLAFFIHMMIAIVALFGTAISYAASIIDAGFVEASGVMATFNLQNTQVINEAQSGQNYSVYTYYRVYDELANLIAADLDNTSDEEAAILERDLDEASELAFYNRFFFPVRYLEPDGSYSRQRQVDELFAEAENRLDLDPNSHFELANQMDAKALDFGLVFIGIGFTVALYALASLFHRERRALRMFFAVAGTIGFAASIWVTVLIEMRG